MRVEGNRRGSESREEEEIEVVKVKMRCEAERGRDVCEMFLVTL